MTNPPVPIWHDFYGYAVLLLITTYTKEARP